MSSRFDVTDDRFKIAANADVIAFIRSANPSAHSDAGGVLFKVCKAIPGARSHCPSTTIGPDWVRFPPFNGRGETGAWERLLRWAGQAFTEAQTG